MAVKNGIRQQIKNHSALIQFSVPFDELAMNSKKNNLRHDTAFVLRVPQKWTTALKLAAKSTTLREANCHLWAFSSK